MKNTFGNAITLTLFGESHGQAIGAVLDGIAPGLEVNLDYIKEKLALRRPSGTISTARVEGDEFEIVSGVFNGYTTGTPLTLLIKNKNTNSGDYADLKDLPRPSHADYTANCKYHGYQDYRGGGHFSGRLTAAIVGACAILQYALEKAGIIIGTHISNMQNIKDSDFTDYTQVANMRNRQFPTITEEAEKQMKELIESVAKEGDSVGGILETCVLGVPVGLGEPWFDTLDGMLSHALFSIPAVKAVEFGAGVAFNYLTGSKANDQFVTDGKTVFTKGNSNGGINGGISNGMPLIFRCTVKPTPSIYKEQDTVRLSTMQAEKLQIKGRHDPAIIHRARAVVDAMTAFVIADMLTVRFGTDTMAEAINSIKNAKKN